MLSRKIGIDQILKHINNNRVIMRTDFNVPIKNGRIADNTRIRATVPSIKKILENNPKSLVLMSHLGRPNGQRVEKHSLKPIVPELQDLIGVKVEFLKDCVGKEVEDAVKSSNNGKVFLLENLRFHIEEEGSIKDEAGKKTKADPAKVKEFRKGLTELGEIYINDAFGTAHRAHSSITGIDRRIRAAGYLLKKELDYFAKALENPQKPFTVILGGAKVKDKIQLIKNLLDKVDEMIIGGGMAFTFLKKKYGIEIGSSLFDKDGYELVDDLLEKAKQKGVKIHLPVDFVVGDKVEASANTEVRSVSQGI